MPRSAPLVSFVKSVGVHGRFSLNPNSRVGIVCRGGTVYLLDFGKKKKKIETGKGCFIFAFLSVLVRLVTQCLLRLALIP